MAEEINIKKSKIYILLCVLFAITNCAGETASGNNLPNNILGIKLGMTEQEAKNRLQEIGKFTRVEPKRQQIWALKDNSRFGYVAVGFDKENKVHYVSAIAAPKSREKMRYTEIGDLSAAKAEIAKPNYIYTWTIPAANGNSPYMILARGTNAEYLNTYTISKPVGGDDEEE